MRLELTIEIPDRMRQTFFSRLEEVLRGRGMIVHWRVIEDPDPNEEHSTKGVADG